MYHWSFIIIGKRDIKALKVKCDNVERNCQWEGTVGTLDAHVATCKFTLVPCPKECKDQKNEITHFMRKDLDKHLENDCPNRDHECKYCGEKGTYAHITQVHDKICKQKIFPCPNKCTKTMPRQDIEKHVELECEYTVIACKFKNIGCTTEMKRGDMATHEQDTNLHLSKALDTVVKLQDYITELQDSNTKLQSNMESATNELSIVKKITLKYGKLITFKITRIQRRKYGNKLFISPSFYTSPGGYHMAIHVYANGNGIGVGTHVSVFTLILKGKYDTELRWPFVGKVAYTLLNQLEDSCHTTRTTDLNAEDNARAKTAWGYPKFILFSKLAHDPGKNTHYLKDDTLYFRVSVDIPDHKPWLECVTK